MSKPKKTNYLLFDFLRATGLPVRLFMRPRIVYLDASSPKRIKGGALVIANHTSHFDPVHLMVAIWYRRHHFVCMKEFFEGSRLRSWLFTQFHCIPVDRENFAVDTLHRITEELKAGHLVAMYPEGRLNTKNEIAPFKSGMTLMAYRSSKPIIPVYIKPRKHWYSRLEVGIGPFVDVKKLLGDHPSIADMNKITAELEETERKLEALVNKK